MLPTTFYKNLKNPLIYLPIHEWLTLPGWLYGKLVGKYTIIPWILWDFKASKRHPSRNSSFKVIFTMKRWCFFGGFLWGTIVTAVRIELKSFTTSNSHSADALFFFHDALIGGCSSFDVKLLWNWIVSKHCWKIKAILWYELVFLFCQDQLFLWLDYIHEARKSASGIIRIWRGVFISEILGCNNIILVVRARRCV